MFCSVVTLLYFQQVRHQVVPKELILEQSLLTLPRCFPDFQELWSSSIDYFQDSSLQNTLSSFDPKYSDRSYIWRLNIWPCILSHYSQTQLLSLRNVDGIQNYFHILFGQGHRGRILHFENASQFEGSWGMGLPQIRVGHSQGRKRHTTRADLINFGRSHSLAIGR